MNKQNLNDVLLYELEADRRHYATVVGELADRIHWFASRLATEGRDDESIHELSEEVTTLQDAMQRSLTKLNNATVQEYMAKERAGIV